MSNVVSLERVAYLRSRPARDIGYDWHDTHRITSDLVALMDNSGLSYAEIAERANGQVALSTLIRWTKRKVWKPQSTTSEAVQRVLYSAGMQEQVLALFLRRMETKPAPSRSP